MWSMLRGQLVLCCLFSASLGAVRELSSVQDAILLNKKEEVSVVLLFDAARDGAALDAFEGAAASFDKGVVFGRSTADEVWKRYGKRARAGPALLLFRDFDPETGKKKRGKKEPTELLLKEPTAGGAAAPSARAIAEFVLAEALPDVVQLPAMGRAGVDAAARSQSALALPLLPKLLLFREGSSKLEPQLAKAAAALRRKVQCLSVDLTDSDAESSAATLKRAGLAPEDLGDDGVLVRVSADWSASTKLKEGAATDADALALFAQGFGEAAAEESEKSGGGGKGGGGKGGDGKSRRPHWITIDEDWAVVTGYGVGSYKEAVNKWRDSGADITSDTCFWKAHGRECMNNSCPACKHGSQ
jgi:hypothetical protein